MTLHLPDSDAASQLIRDAKNGDPAAFGQLALVCDQWLLFIANRFPASHKQPDGPSGCVQETYARALKNLHQFRGETLGQLKAWLRAILKNVIREKMRRPMGAEGPLAELFDDRPTPEDDAAWREWQAACDDALAALPEQLANVVRLRMKGWTLHEIGEHERCSHMTAQRRYKDAIKRLDQQLDSHRELCVD